MVRKTKYDVYDDWFKATAVELGALPDVQAQDVAEEAYPKMRGLAIKYSVGFFDISADNGEILFPGESSENKKKTLWWKF